MRFPSLRVLNLISGALLAAACGAPALADDSEVFTNSAFVTGTGVRPNILFVVDSSGSMREEVVLVYDSTATYVGPCDPDRIYWRTQDTEEPPDCTTTTNWIPVSLNTCNSAVGTIATAGFWRGRTQQWSPPDTQWRDARSGAQADPFECQTDSGIHGETAASSLRYARNHTARWGSQSQSISWQNRQRLTLYSGNYGNFWYGSGGGGQQKTRLEVVVEVAKNLTDSLNGVNLGLMRYSNNGGLLVNDSIAQGGMILHPVTELTAGDRTTIKSLLDNLNANGYTPLSETYYESYLYMSGGNVDYGDQSRLDFSTPYPSIASSRVGGTASSGQYQSPMQYSCQKNYIVYLTDGLPTADSNADAKIQALPDFATVGGSCPDPGPNPDWPDSGRCMVSLARYMQESDLRPDAAGGPVGKQNVTTFVVGFGSDIATSKDFLDEVAVAGGSDKAYTANSVGGLTAALQEIFTTILEGKDLTFTSPTISVNAFNRAQNLSDLYVSVFSPARKLHWPGNLKKYQLIGGQILDAAGSPAVEPSTGFFDEDARSFWSKDINGVNLTDGADVIKGGASSRQPSYIEGLGGRNVYTYLGNADLSHASNALALANTAITDVLMGTGGVGQPTLAQVVAFARGEDLTDENGNAVTAERRMRMGDPMHARPAVVIYSGTTSAPEGLVFVPTNDGYLHAVDSNTGVEQWSFVPPEFLTRLASLYQNPVTPSRTYAIDGDIRVLKFDVDRDGVVEPIDGDYVHVYFGFARGGSSIYALDVTDKTRPLMKWKLTDANLPGLGQAWSTPTIARVNIQGATQSTGKFVLVFGGGYDTAQENYSYTADGVGNRIFMIDADTGSLLWYAGNTALANLNLVHMNNSIPGEITALDLDGDKFADRMYAADMGGRLWRFDIWNGNAVGSLVTGGMIAALGAGEQLAVQVEDQRRFYYAPDVALIERRGTRPFFNLAIGSGYRGHPLETATHDRFYSIRDYLPFTKMTQAQYILGEATPITDADPNLVNITGQLNPSVPDGATGWKLELSENGGWVGEKVLAQSVTVSNFILFPTFTPTGPDPTNPCLTSTLNRVYAISVDNGRPFADFNGDDQIDVTDRSQALRQAGIAAELAVIVNNGDPDGAGPLPPARGSTTCLSGVEILNQCVPTGGVVRTYWERR